MTVNLEERLERVREVVRQKWSEVEKAHENWEGVLADHTLRGIEKRTKEEYINIRFLFIKQKLKVEFGYKSPFKYQ